MNLYILNEKKEGRGGGEGAASEQLVESDYLHPGLRIKGGLGPQLLGPSSDFLHLLVQVSCVTSGQTGFVDHPSRSACG